MFGMRKGTPEGVFKTLRNALDKRDFKYEVDEDNQAIGLSVMGDDLPISTMIQVNDNHVRFTAILAFKAIEASYKDVAWNLNLLNTELTFGSFSLNPEDGIVRFDYSYIISNAKPTEDILIALLKMVWTTVDEHDGDLKKIVPVARDIDNPMFGRIIRKIVKIGRVTPAYLFSILPFGSLFEDLIDECLDIHCTKISLVPAPDGEVAVLDLFLTDDEHVRCLLKLSLTDLVSDLLISVVDLTPDSGSLHPVVDGIGIFSGLLGDGKDLDLNGCKPNREPSSIVLNQNSDEPLDGSEDDTVDHDRSVLVIVGTDV